MKKHHFRPGKKLEHCFDRWIDHWNTIFGILAIRIEVRTSIKDGKMQYKKKQPADYLIIGKKNCWLIDSKECSKNKFCPKQQPKHQILEMNRIRQVNENAKSGFVIWFKKDDPAMINLRFIENFDRPSTIEDGQKFVWDKMFT